MPKPQLLLYWAASASLIVAAPCGRTFASQTAVSLRAERARGGVDRVELTFEVAGDLKWVEEGKVQRGKMSVVASFLYSEKPLELPGDTDGPLRSVRYYDQAEGAVKSGEHEYRPRLRDQRRLIGVEVDGREVTVFSPQGRLTADERELIDTQGNSLLLDRLLPTKPVATGGTWALSDDLVIALLGLETVTRNEGRSTFRGVADGKARIEVSGRVAGSVRGATAEIELKGQYYFDMKRKRITWFGLLVRENRSIGHVDTGFDAVARLQIKITPGIRCEHLTDAALAQVALKATAELTQLDYESTGGTWRLSHDRRWFVINDQDDRAVLRMIEDGDRLAQCNVAPLSHAADSTELTVEAFQKDVARVLGDHFKNFVQARQRHSEADYRLLRVVAEGESSKVPMQWIYYLVADRHGRRVVLGFVIEQDKLDRFDQADRQLVSTLRLIEPAVASKPNRDAAEENGRR